MQLGADLVVFSELFLVGYPPEDLVLRPALVQAATATLEELIRESAGGGPGLVITLPWSDNGSLHNAVALVADGHAEVRYKHELPNYGVFDEKRVFGPGPLPEPVDFRGVRLGLPVCEDVWFPTVAEHLAARGAELLIVPNGSPFEVDKSEQRLALITRTRPRMRPAADLREPGRRPGRAGVRRRIVRGERGRRAGAGAAVVEGVHRADGMGAHAGGLAL